MATNAKNAPARLLGKKERRARHDKVVQEIPFVDYADDFKGKKRVQGIGKLIEKFKIWYSKQDITTQYMVIVFAGIMAIHANLFLLYLIF
ncbi:MAG: hypothetical protein COV70_04275 [Parcubacteria group bacterium CG11_big_fil_rev_8_21_14_0_20_39_22]|nr:MAG: hypothetical protein COV70_04275 [Parcubacteria group bacterium CG11_big_fil_rev_8_21_14_0_20_39_22]